MAENSPKLYHISILTQTGVTIFSQQLGKEVIDSQLLDSISTIALGFKNTMDVTLSSVNYQNYTIYFRRATNFLAVLLANAVPGVEDIIDKMFNDMLDQEIIAKFVEFANHDILCNDEEIITSIRKILFNLDFVNSISEIKKGISKFGRF